MQSENPFEELNGECFICMEECNTPTKCACNLFVHKECLDEFIQKDGRDTCSICQQKYPTNHCTYSYKDIFKIILGCIFVYLISGIIGEFLFAVINNKTLVIHSPWTLEYFIGALCITLLLFFIKSIANKI